MSQGPEETNTRPAFEFTALKRKRVSETVADQIRQAIFGGKLLPGQKLPSERVLAVQLQTSRVALREALRALENEGMIGVKRGFGGGAFVADFEGALRALRESLDTVVKLGQANSAHLTEVRTMIEPQIAMFASLRATPADLSAIEEVLLAQEEEIRTNALSRKYDMEFHRLMAEAAHNPVLSIVATAVNDALRDSIFRSKLTREMRIRVVANHRTIFDAVRSQDTDLVQCLATEHVTAVQCHLETTTPTKR